MGGSVVLNLIAKLPLNIKYRLSFDNFFTSLPLIEHLERINIGVTGTIRLNQIGKTPLLDLNSMKKMQRGNYCYVKEKIQTASSSSGTITALLLWPLIAMMLPQ